MSPVKAVLFCCDQNSVRSPMAEGLLKQVAGQAIYVQSAGVATEREIDGFAIAVCQEIGVELARHKSRNFAEMQTEGEDISSFDLIVALSKGSHRKALDLTRTSHLTVEFWDILDPTAIGETRENKLTAYRITRDQIRAQIEARFGTR